jgi:hypothetical protein
MASEPSSPQRIPPMQRRLVATVEQPRPFFCRRRRGHAPHSRRPGPPQKPAKRGGQADRIELRDSAIAATEPDDDVLALNDALEQLSTTDPVAANLVKFRYFAGFNMTEVAQSLNMSVRSPTKSGPTPGPGYFREADAHRFFVDWHSWASRCSSFLRSSR